MKGGGGASAEAVGEEQTVGLRSSESGQGGLRGRVRQTQLRPEILVLLELAAVRHEDSGS